MRKMLSLVMVAVILGITSAGCSAVYYRTWQNPKRDETITEFGFLGFPVSKNRSNEFQDITGLLPLWRKVVPAEKEVEE